VRKTQYKNHSLDLGIMKSKRRGEIHAVIFELVIPSDLQSVVFADISYLSKMIGEQEILFDLGTVFVTSDVAYDDNEQIWNIRLTASDKGRNIITKEYIDYYREHTMHLSPTIKLGEFLIVVGQYEKARDYFDSVLKCDYDDEVHILYNLAWIDRCQGKYIDARVKLDHAYELEIDKHSPSQTTLRNILIDSGTLHLILNEPNFAMNCFLRADKMGSTSAVLNNIGLTYRHKCQWDKALEFFNKALTLDTDNWPNGHYRIGIILDNIGRTYNDMGRYRKALKFHLQGLKIKQKTLPDDHMDTGISLNNVGFTYDNLDMYDKALIYYKRALNIYQMCLPKFILNWVFYSTISRSLIGPKINSRNVSNIIIKHSISRNVSIHLIY
jgi:tetratricopeptide (TPR) repeat protein